MKAMQGRGRAAGERSGFSMLEIVIGFVVLVIFMLPLVTNITRIKRVSLAARDSVIATSHALSLIGDLRALRYDQLDSGNASFSALTKRYETRVSGGVTFRANATIADKEVGRVKELTVELTFAIPGVKEGDASRKLVMKDFVCAPVP